MSDRVSHIWSPIQDLPDDWRSLASPELGSLVGAWQSRAEEMRENLHYKEFLVRLRREWAIETGFIERLYYISDGATKTLIEQGLDAALLIHEDVDLSPEQVVAHIQDQHRTIEGLYTFISGSRGLTKSYLRELHAALTAHQDTYDAIDTLGNRVKRELPKGEWKRFKNNVENLAEGYSFEFCPPEHVDAEIERLLAAHREHESAGVSPDVEAAWLHHAFTLIHPFVDGNGRVARCLATLVFLKARWFPLVVTREDYAGYVNALRAADSGDLRPLISLFGSLQSRAVRQALSLSQQVVNDATAVSSILGSVRAGFFRRRGQEESAKKKVLLIGSAVQDSIRRRLLDVGKEVEQAIKGFGADWQVYVNSATDHETNRQFYRYQIVKVAKELGYFANMPVFASWAALVIRTDTRAEVLFSVHGLGREFAGVLACTAMVYFKQTTDDGETQIGDVIRLSDEPFYLTYDEQEAHVLPRFAGWSNDCILKGLDHWRRGMGA